jgi:hypothetical protein
MDWATFWATFSQTNLVNLFGSLISATEAVLVACYQGDRTSALNNRPQNVAQPIFYHNFFRGKKWPKNLGCLGSRKLLK